MWRSNQQHFTAPPARTPAVRRIARAWWPVAAGAALGLVVGAFLTLSTQSVYTASTVLFLGSPASTDSSGAYQGDLFSQQRAATYAQLFASDDLAAKVIDDLGLTVTPRDLASRVSAKQVPKTVLLSVSASDPSAKLAADIANAYSVSFTEYVTKLETPVPAGRPAAVVTVVQKAEVPAAPSSPTALMSIAGGLIAGAAVGAALLWLRRRIDRSVRTPKQLADATGSVVIGELPIDRWRRQAPLTLPGDSFSPYAEAIRQLRTAVIFADVDNPPRTIVVTSPLPDDGTVMTTVNLALLFADAGRRVALIDTDLRHPQVDKYLGLGALRGLAQVLTGAAALGDALIQPRPNLSVLPGGGRVSSPSELLASDAIAKVLVGLSESHDIVLIAAAPLLPFTDTAAVASRSDGVILTAHHGKTRLADAAKAADGLRAVRARVIGTVLTETTGAE